jgi:hypothetical protein
MKRIGLKRVLPPLVILPLNHIHQNELIQVNSKKIF